MLTQAKPLDTDFWENRLEVNTDLVRKQHADTDLTESWVDRLDPRARSVIAGRLRVPAELGVRETRATILEQREHLLDYMLVEAATSGKRTYAIVEVAKARLAQQDLDRCEIGEGKFDRFGLMLLLFFRRREDLELVFHFDQTQRRGFARMVLAEEPRDIGASAVPFLTEANVQGVLDEYERKKRSKRESVCSAVIENGGNVQIFIKRDNRSAFVAHGRRNTFGFEPEWIVLEFSPDLAHVDISSESPDVPLEIANRIAEAFFKEKVSYENASTETPEEEVRKFLDSLVAEPERLPLVEFHVKNSPFDGSPHFSLSDPENHSLASAVTQISAVLRGPLEAIEDIESIKVHALKKRVKMIFEPVEGGGRYIVRFADQPLTASERRAFERRMKEDYGLLVLSTEKRYAQ